MARILYADHNATTPVGQAAREAMIHAMDAWGNPSSTHGVGRQAREILEKARSQVAKSCGVESKEVIFTSGGSEANALCILGTHFGNDGPLRMVSAATEHSSVRAAVDFVESRGAKVGRVRVLPTGALDLDHLESLLKELRPHLVSLMAANNETGVLHPTAEISALCNQYEAVFHCDCVQAFGKIAAEHWNFAGLISVSSHKIYGPKGVGAAIVRGGRKLVPLPFGGTQEVKRRGGTENMVGIAGFGAAAEQCLLPMDERVAAVRDRFEAQVLSELPGVSVNGGGTQRAPNTSNLRFEGLVSEVLLGILDISGVCVSAGSACSSGSIAPSPVLLAMGLTKEQARESVRFSWGRETTPEDVDAIAALVIQHVKRIRSRPGR